MMISDFTVLLATHTVVALCAWLNGFTAASFLERRGRAEAALYPSLDLTDPRPAYDWQADGEATEQP